MASHLLSGRGIEGASDRPMRRSAALSVNESPQKPGADSEDMLGGADAAGKNTWRIGTGTSSKVRKAGTRAGHALSVPPMPFNGLRRTIVLAAAGAAVST